MEPRLQRRIQRYGWDKAASEYELYWQRQLEPAQRRLIEMARLGAGERVVEIACGTGLVTVRIAEAVGPTGRVLASDISEGMLARAREETRERGLENISFERRDAEDLGARDGAFDAAVCALGLMLVAEPRAAIAEMHRVVSPGGRAVVAVWGERSRCGWAPVFPIVDSRVASEVCPLFFHLGTRDALNRAFEAVGFANVESERIATTLHYDSRDEAVGAAFRGGAVALAYARFDEKTREEANSEYLAAIEPFRNGDAFDIPGEFVVARGEKPADM